jgi:hypothetical protein
MAKTYTVQRGDSLSKIYKSLGYGSWQDLWNNWKGQSKSGNPSLIYGGEKIPYKNQPAAVTSSVSTKTKTPSQQITDPIEIATREQFAKRFGSLDEITPEAAFTQFGAQQVTPTYYRQAADALRDIMRNASSSGAFRVGQTNSRIASELSSIEAARKEAVNQYVNQQKSNYTDWYNTEMDSYMNAANPAKWAINEFDLTGYGVAPGSYDGQFRYDYNPVNLKDYFGGYGSMWNKPEQMYGELVKTKTPLLNPDRSKIRY